MILISSVAHRFVDSKNCQILESEDIVVLDDDQNDIYAWRPLGYLGIDGGLHKHKLKSFICLL